MAKDTQTDTQPRSEAETGTSEQRYGPLDYLIANVVVIAFCILQFAVVKFVTGEQIGLSFFFGSIIVGFMIVSVFMYIYDVVAEGTEDEDTPAVSDS